MESSREKTRSLLASLALPPVVLAIFDRGGAEVHPALSYRVERPETCFAGELDSDPLIVPLWECGDLVTAYRIDSQDFVQFGLETPDDPYWQCADFHAVVAELLVDLWEDGLVEPDLRVIAGIFGFAELDQLLTFLDSEVESGAAHEWIASRPAS